jgi:hypothetical protein
MDADVMQTQWTTTDRLVGQWSCYLVFGLSVAYLPTTAAGFVFGGGLTGPIRDPYFAVMELLILLLAPALVVTFAALHAYAPVSKKILSHSALVLVALMAGMTLGVHFIALTVGRHANEATLPGFSLLFSWTWPSMIYALDITAWDFCLGLALLLAAPVFSQRRGDAWVRRGMVISGILCLGGLVGVVLGNVNVRDIGIVGYAVVLPIVILRMGRLFAATSTRD